MTQKMRAEVISLPASTSSALVASATSMKHMINKVDRKKKVPTAEAWQTAAWLSYDAVGEFHYAVTWVGNLLSKARLVIHRNGEPTTEQVALDLLASLAGGPEGQSDMLRLLGINFTVAGEAYLVGISNGGDEDDDWMVVPATKFSVVGRRYKIFDTMYDADSVLAVRMWRPHPADIRLPDAPSRPALSILAQIEALSEHINAQITSRLAGAGILFLPSNITFATGGGSGTLDTANSAEAFVSMLIDTMETAIADRSNPSAMVPIVVQAEGEHLDKIHHLTFWSELEEHALALRQEAITRLGTGLDMPPEILTGQGDMNHWSSWQVEEAAIKAHSEPLLSVIIAALNKGYLRPLLLAEGVPEEEVMEYSIHADTAQMRLRPNRSAEAIELYDRGVLDAATVIRENGFDPESAMKEDERKLWFIRKVAGGSTTPELVAAALAYLGVPLDGFIAPEGEEPPETQEARPTRSLEEHPRREIPDPDESLTAAAEVMVFRALERAGNRLKTRLGTKNPEVAAVERYQFVSLDASTVDSLLEDAWGMTGQFCYGKDPERLAACLDGYTRSLLVEGAPHNRELLKKHLSAMEK